MIMIDAAKFTSKLFQVLPTYAEWGELGTISHSLVANKEKHPARLLVMHPTKYIPAGLKVRL